MTLFSNDQNNSDDVTYIDPNKDYLSEYVGDGKKFADAKQLALGKAESDLFIERLKKENAGIRQELAKRGDEEATRARLEEILTKITALSNKEQSPNTDTQPDGNKGTKDTALDANKLDEIVASKLNAFLGEKEKDDNYARVISAAKKKFGDNYADALTMQAKEMDLDTKKMEELAKSSPKAFMKTFGIEESAPADNSGTQFAPPRTRMNSDGFRPKTSSEKTYSYYEELRAKDPKKFWDPQTQNQRHKDAQRLGEAFFDD